MRSFSRVCVCFSLIALLCLCTDAQLYAAKKHHEKDNEASKAKASGEKNHSKKEGESAKAKAGGGEKGLHSKNVELTKTKPNGGESSAKTTAKTTAGSSDQKKSVTFDRHPEDREQFEKNHPRQTEVLKRTDREKAKIDQDLQRRQDHEVATRPNG